MSFSADQSRRLDEVVEEVVATTGKTVEGLIREFAEQEVVRRFGQQPVVPALEAPRERFREVVAAEMSGELASRIAERLLGAYAAA